MKFVQIFLFFLLSIKPILCIFKEQEGEYNWRKSLIGMIDHSVFSNHLNSNGNKAIYTLSYNSSMVSSIHPKNGELQWRFSFPREQYVYAQFLASNTDLIHVVQGIKCCLLTSISTSGDLLWEVNIDTSYCVPEVKLSNPQKDMVIISSFNRLMVVSNIHSSKHISWEWNADSYVDLKSKDQMILITELIPSFDTTSSSSSQDCKITLESLPIAIGCVVNKKDKNRLCQNSVILSADLSSKNFSISSYKPIPVDATKISVRFDTISVGMNGKGSLYALTSTAEAVKVYYLDLEKNELISSTYRSTNGSEKSKLIPHFFTQIPSDSFSFIVCFVESFCEVVSFLNLDRSITFEVIAKIEPSSSFSSSMIINPVTMSTKSVKNVFYSLESSPSILLIDKEKRKLSTYFLSQAIDDIVHIHFDDDQNSILIQSSMGTIFLFRLNNEMPLKANLVWKREEAMSYTHQILMVNTIDESLLINPSKYDRNISITTDLITSPSFEQRLALQQKEIMAYMERLTTLSFSDLIDMLKEAINKVIPSSYLSTSISTSSASQKNLLDTRLHSNKIAIFLCIVPQKHGYYILLTGIDVAYQKVIWTTPIQHTKSSNAVETKMVLYRKATAAKPSTLLLFLWDINDSTSTSYVVDTMSGKSSIISKDTTISDKIGSENYVLESIVQTSDGSSSTHDMNYYMVLRDLSQDTVRVQGIDGRTDLKMDKFYFHTINKVSGEMKFYVKQSNEIKEISSIVFPSQAETIVAHFYANQDPPNSKFIVLGDDSILLKYLNPQLVVIASIHPPEAAVEYYNPIPTATNDDINVLSTLVLTFIDAVSGRVLHRMIHENGVSPVHGTFVDSSSSLVISYWNCKAKRTEISSISLFDGLVEKFVLNPFSTPATSTTVNQLHRNSNFSSFASSSPLAMQRTYWLPRVTINGMFTTTTTASITNKNVIVTTNTGQMLMLDMRHINPRRPITTTTQAEKEEGLQQYHPMLLLNPSASYLTVTEGNNCNYIHTINHNHNHNDNNHQGNCYTGLYNQGKVIVACAATGLESTVAILSSWGPDIFFNIGKPSQSFDSLASDFNYWLLVTILFVLAVLVVIMRRQSSQKKLAVAWM